jgi:hypothetical protein
VFYQNLISPSLLILLNLSHCVNTVLNTSLLDTPTDIFGRVCCCTHQIIASCALHKCVDDFMVPCPTAHHTWYLDCPGRMLICSQARSQRKLFRTLLDAVSNCCSCSNKKDEGVHVQRSGTAVHFGAHRLDAMALGSEE